MKIVKKSFYIAEDEDGNTYSLKNWNIPDPVDEIIQSDVKGELITEEKQDRYTDGSYARSYQEIIYFKIIKTYEN